MTLSVGRAKDKSVAARELQDSKWFKLISPIAQSN
jgi:hypothetical protein